jgi:hypothetical protein
VAKCGEISVFGLCFVSREIECSSAILSLTEFLQKKRKKVKAVWVTGKACSYIEMSSAILSS